NYNVSRIEAHKFTLALYVPRLTEEFLAVGSHLTQLFSRVVHGAKLGVSVSNGHELGHPNGIDVSQSAAPAGREADTVDQTHVGCCSWRDDAVVLATDGIQATAHYHY